MRVYVQIIDTKTGIYQHGMIDEYVEKEFEIQNAIEHFGNYFGKIKWINNYISPNNSLVSMFGMIEETTKVITVVTI